MAAMRDRLHRYDAVRWASEFLDSLREDRSHLDWHILPPATRAEIVRDFGPARRRLLLLDYDGTLVHYRAPTEPGSSGSPVLNKRWSVIALHHSGDNEMPRLHGTGVYEANEGIRIDQIQSALLRDL